MKPKLGIAVFLLSVVMLTGAVRSLSAAEEKSTVEQKLDAMQTQLDRLEDNQKKILEKLDQISEEHRQLRFMVHKR